jgi:hypothetical protein
MLVLRWPRDGTVARRDDCMIDRYRLDIKRKKCAFMIDLLDVSPGAGDG